MATKGAPMPKKENEIVDNPMKLYSYLVCISGLAIYPDNTRMFRQKDLMFTKIKNFTGITNDTVKLYLYHLEENEMIIYRGEYQFNFINKYSYSVEQKKEYRAACLEEAKRVWGLRYKEEKNGVYHIPRPNPYTPIPEQTLERLNKEFQCSDLELKLYLLCCGYKDECDYRGLKYKAITFEQIRDSFKIKHTGAEANKEIRMALMFLKVIGLINYTEGKSINRKNAAIPCFKISDVKFYIDYKIEKYKTNEILNDKDYQEVFDRIFKVQSLQQQQK